MTTYKLTATRNGARREILFPAQDDNQATFDAIFKILDKATNSEIWAKGAIQLHNCNTGELLKEMEEK